MNLAAESIGLLAGILTTAAFVPQVVRTWRTRSAGDLSTSMFVVFGAGVFLWLIYGIAIESVPVMVANAVTFLLAVVVLVLKHRYR